MHGTRFPIERFEVARNAVATTQLGGPFGCVVVLAGGHPDIKLHLYGWDNKDREIEAMPGLVINEDFQRIDVEVETVVPQGGSIILLCGPKDTLGIDAPPSFLDDVSSAHTLATGQVNVGVATTPIVAARAGRKNLILRRAAVANDIYLGGSAVTTGDGLLWDVADTFSFEIPNFSGALFGITTVADQAVSYMEIY